MYLTKMNSWTLPLRPTRKSQAAIHKLWVKVKPVIRACSAWQASMRGSADPTNMVFRVLASAQIVGMPGLQARPLGGGTSIGTELLLAFPPLRPAGRRILPHLPRNAHQISPLALGSAFTVSFGG